MSSPLVKESKVDVLVIGAGPSGLLCANGLIMAGVNVRIVDIRRERVAAGQADGLQPRTLEILQSYGLAERLLRDGRQLHGMSFWGVGPDGGIVPRGKAADINTASSRARYPFELTMHQGDIESIFIDSMASMGLRTERPVAPSSIEVSTDEAELMDPTSNPIKVVLKHLADEDLDEVVRAKFVVGADGAHSWARKTLGIEMEGEHTDSLWGVLDICPETNFPNIRFKNIVQSEFGTCGIVPREDDMVRLYIQIPEEDLSMDADGKLVKTEATPEKLLGVTQNILKPYTLTAEKVHWWTVYKIGQRVATKYSVHDRVLIVGDACHTHSPKAGQGMNASMCDSHNLVWKLAQVLRGWADISLLKTYEAERRRYAQDLIDFDKMYSQLISNRPAKDEALSNLDQVSSAFKANGEFTSGLSVHYAPSAIVDASNQSLASKLTIGKRMHPHTFVRAADARPYEIHDLLPADIRFKVLVFAGNTNEKEQMQRMSTCAEHLGRSDAFFKRFGGENPAKMFSLLIVSSESIFTVDFVELIRVFRTHWSQVFVDDAPMYEYRNAVGDGYEAYGIDRAEGAIVVVRPDGYVAKVTSIDRVSELDVYFSSFMKT